MTPPPCLCLHSRIDHDGRHGECSAQCEDGEDCACEGYDLGPDCEPETTDE